MTIAAGFLCPDGIVLAADTLYSGENKRYAAKIWTVEKGDLLIVFAGAGMATSIAKVHDEANIAIRTAMTAEDAVDALDAVLGRVARKLLPVSGEVPNLLVAVRSATSGFALFENDGGVVLAHAIKKSLCIGCGASLGLYFADSLFEEGMSVKWASVIAAHLLKQTKKYADGCGGESQIVIIPPSGDWEKSSPAEIDNLEGYFGAIDEAMRVVLPSGEITETTLAHRLEILNAAIIKARQASHVIAVPTGHVSIVGNWISPVLLAGFTSGPSTPLALRMATEKKEDE